MSLAMPVCKSGMVDVVDYFEINVVCVVEDSEAFVDFEDIDDFEGDRDASFKELDCLVTDDVEAFNNAEAVFDVGDDFVCVNDEDFELA